MIIEVCANSIQSAINAANCGIQRIELCNNLEIGGTTPTLQSIPIIKEKTNLQVFVLIRPRGGDFCYTDLEMELMLANIQAAKKLGADGIVSGVLKPDGSVDLVRTTKLIENSYPLPFTFHRAFDQLADPKFSLEQLIDMGVHRILTSGQSKTAIMGKDALAKLNTQAKGRVVIIAGGSIAADHVKELIEVTGVEEIHLSAKSIVESKMSYQKDLEFFGNGGYDFEETDEEKLKSLMEQTAGA